jgi:hypothetical protein
MTDWQQPLIVALTQAQGTSVVHETVYENRFQFTEALNDMGADITVHKDGLPDHDRRVARREFEQAAVINGPTALHGADIRVPDLRGGFSREAAQARRRLRLQGLIGRCRLPTPTPPSSRSRREGAARRKAPSSAPWRRPRRRCST